MERPQSLDHNALRRASAEQASAAARAEKKTDAEWSKNRGCRAWCKQRILRVREKLGLDNHTLLLMFKGSLPPIICIALLQIPALAHTLNTVGYLVPIVSVLANTIAPRGRFLKTLLLHLLSVCTAAAMSMLLLFAGVSARHLTSTVDATTPNTFPQPYNASQSAVSGVFLFFNIWLVNSFKAKWLPAFALPAMVYSIFVNIASTFGVHFLQVATAEAFVTQIMSAMLLGLGVAAVVSICVVPESSRRIYGRCMVQGFGLVREAVGLQRAWMRDLEEMGEEDEGGGGSLKRVETSVGRSDGRVSPKTKKGDNAQGRRKSRQETAHELRATIVKIRDLAGKTYREVRSAKRDIAYGKLSAHHLGELYLLFRKVFIPVIGMSTIMDIFHGASEGSSPLTPATEDGPGANPKEMWNDIMKRLHEPFNQLSSAIDQGLEHASIQLELVPRPRRKKSGCGLRDDIEARGKPLKPGDNGFSAVVADKVRKFSIARNEILNAWACEQGLLEDGAVGIDVDSATAYAAGVAGCKKRRQAQLFVILYIEQLMHATGEAAQMLAEFADARVADGTMSNSHFIVPGLTKLRKWAKGMFSDGREYGESTEDGPGGGAGVGMAYVGCGFDHRRNPEHLPPENAWERLGDGFRTISRFVSSRESMFGIRVALAVMTVGILCFLERTQVFFQEQRLVWAMIITGFAMSQTAGQTVFGLFERTAGSALALVAALVQWYIVGGHTAGVIIMLWLFLFLEYYAFIKYPRYTPTSTIAVITQVLIIGYELQVRIIGVTAAQASGQQVYPPYLFGPYRLATVVAGCLVAFIWTVFPSPVTDRTWLRRDLGAVLYLLANYVSAIHETLRLTLTRGTSAGDAHVKGTPAARLLKVRAKIYSKLMLLLPSLEVHSRWQRYEPKIGGRFPRAVYDDIILRSNRIMNYLTLMSYTIAWTPREEHAESQSESAALEQEAWSEAIAEVADTMGPTNYALVSTLTLLSNSMLSGQCLPPHIPLPRPFELTRRLMDVEHHHHRADDDGLEEDTDDEGDGDRGDRARLLLRDGASSSRTKREKRIQNLLDPRNMEQRGYTGFAVLQVCSALLTDDLKGMVDAVSGLVGVVDFSFPDIGSESSMGSGSGTGDGSCRGSVEDGRRRKRD